jgi:NADPH:quinone reductase-like Zn-dependent oxidoreductase
VGGAGTFVKSLRSVRPGGQVHLVGGVSGFTGEVPLAEIIRNLVTVRGIYVGSRAMFEALNRAVALHRTRPVIDRVFEFADARAAYQYQQSGKHFGKVVISI